MIAFTLSVALGTLALGLAGALVIRRLPSVRLRLAGLALVATVVPVIGMFGSGLVVFESEHDLLMAGVAGAASLGALVGAGLVARSITTPLAGLRAATTTMGAGDLSAVAPTHGPGELRDVALEFNRMARDVEALFDARRELVAWASHDLRTPLAAMQAMIEALEDGIAAPERYLPALRDQVRSLSMIVDDLFELACIDAGALRLELRDAAVGSLIETCVDGLEAEARARGIRVETRFADASSTALCAPEKVERVVYNLLSNALSHTPSEGSVAVRVRPAVDAIEISVADSGVGIASDALGRVFEPFWRGDRARAGGGAGLGLAIARGLVEAQGGRIWAENGPEGGAVVSFTLPRNRPR